jgi:hypothetical protein
MSNANEQAERDQLSRDASDARRQPGIAKVTIVRLDTDLQVAHSEIARLREELEIANGGYEGAQQAEVEARTLLLNIRTQLYHFFAEESGEALNQQAAQAEVER